MRGLPQPPDGSGCKHRQSLHNPNRLQTDCDHLPNQLNDVLRIVRTVRIVDDAASFVRLDAILVYHPFQRRPIPKPIFKRLRGYSVEGQEIVVHKLRFVFGQFHLLHPPIERHFTVFDECELILGHLFIADVDFPQSLPGFGKPPKVRPKRQARQVPLEVGLISLPIIGVMQDRRRNGRCPTW